MRRNRVWGKRRVDVGLVMLFSNILHNTHSRLRGIGGDFSWLISARSDYTTPMTNPLKKSIAVSYIDKNEENKAKMLADRLHIPFVLPQTMEFEYILLFTPDHLCLQKTGSRETPLFIDLLSEEIQYRLKKISLKKEVLARALGLKKNVPLSIVDATGGLLRDSLIIAALGFDVQIFERSPIIHALQVDALERASFDPIVQRMHLFRGDAIEMLPLLDKPDVIYIDPMFPPRKKSALPKKEMIYFKNIVGNDLDAENLLKTALACASSRVVVKRPRIIENLTENLAPSFSLGGSSCRFDVYLSVCAKYK